MSLFWMFVVTLVMLQMSVFFTTVYLHRAMTHGGLRLHASVANAMHLYLSLFTGIVPREWVAIHRKHHHFSDKEGDPHSPYLKGMWRVFFLNFFYYGQEKKDQGMVKKYTPHYKPDLIDRIPGINWGAYAGLCIFMLMFGWKWGFVAWAFHGVVYILLNSGVNSFCHMVGYRNFHNLATNFTVWAWITGGEGLHNNHHERPTSAKFSVKRKEIDLGYGLIWFLKNLGLAELNAETHS